MQFNPSPLREPTSCGPPSGWRLELDTIPSQKKYAFLSFKKCLPAENSVDRHFSLFSKARYTRIVDMKTAGTAEIVEFVETVGIAGIADSVGTVGTVEPVELDSRRIHHRIHRHIRHHIRTLGIMHCLINYR